jgi:bacterioferritin
MAFNGEIGIATQCPGPDQDPPLVDQSAITAPGLELEQGVATPHSEPGCQGIIEAVDELLDDSDINASELHLEQGIAAPHFDPGCRGLIEMLNDSLATELVCVLRYKRHYFTAGKLEAQKIANEFLGYAKEESGHADRLAHRIVQLGGEPDFSPDSLSRRSHVAYDDSPDLAGMIQANLIAESAVIESYLQIIKLIGDQDSTTRRLVEDILTDELWHADELKDRSAE